ncbi:MAG: hypothetical protein FJ109_14310 [Deltaproteobacteria bacterium]|nr:hypothetical protein [Deltaproteobacteria bacterium]
MDSSVTDTLRGFERTNGLEDKKAPLLSKSDEGATKGLAGNVALDGDDSLARDQKIDEASAARERNKMEKNADARVPAAEETEARWAMEARKASVEKESADRPAEERKAKAEPEADAWYADTRKAEGEKGEAAPREDRGSKSKKTAELEEERPVLVVNRPEEWGQDVAEKQVGWRVDDAAAPPPEKPAEAVTVAKTPSEAQPVPKSEGSGDRRQDGVAAGGAVQPGYRPESAAPVVTESRSDDAGKKQDAAKDAEKQAETLRTSQEEAGIVSLLVGKELGELAGQVVDAQEKKAEEKTREEVPQQKENCAATWDKLLALEKAGKNADALALLEEFRTGACAGYVTAEAIGFKEADLLLASGQKDRARKVLNRLKLSSPPAEQKAMDMLESIEK